MRSHRGESSHITLAATLRCGEIHFPTKRKFLFSMHSLLQCSACIVACADGFGRATLTAARSAGHVPWSAWHVPRRPSGRQMIGERIERPKKKEGKPRMLIVTRRTRR